MDRDRTSTPLLLAAVAGMVLAVLLSTTPGTAGPVTPEAPRSLRLPSGQVVQVRAASTGPDGQLEVPDDPRSAGWWRGGAGLGDPSGSILVAAHVDSPHRGLGPFAELYDVRPGVRLVVRSAGLRQDFRVHSVRSIPRGSLADRPELYAPGGRSQLVLVTCAPPYDPARGGYQNLLVLVAEPSGSLTRTGES